MKPSNADAIRWISTNSLVRCIHLHSFIPSWQGDLVKIHLLAVQTTKWLKNWYVPYQMRGKYTPLSLSSTWALTSNICLRDSSTCSCYQFLYNAAERCKISKIGHFFSDWNLRFAKAGKSKQSSLTHDLVSSLVYKGYLMATLGGNMTTLDQKNAIAASRQLHLVQLQQRIPESFLLNLENIISSIWFCFVSLYG